MTTPQAAGERALAERALACLDLTSLSPDDRPGDAIALCERAETPFGPVAAVCIAPHLVATAARALQGTGIRLATVANFPRGAEPAQAAAAECAERVAHGAQEIDLAFPYEHWQQGRHEQSQRVVALCRETLGDTTVLKVIMETGAWSDEADLARAARAAIDAGADYLKTSTGTIPVGATPEAARILLEAISEAGIEGVGFKASGGIRTLEDAARYIALADDHFGVGWATPRTFRIGASSLLDRLLEALTGDAPQ